MRNKSPIKITFGLKGKSQEQQEKYFNTKLYDDGRDGRYMPSN